MNKLTISSLLVIVFVCLITLTACGSFSESAKIANNSLTYSQPSKQGSPKQGNLPTPTSNEGSGVPLERNDVDWNLLAPGTRESIDTATAAGNCKLLNELYSEFNAESDQKLKKYFADAFILADCG